jgi:hypothetical protein
MIYNDAEYMKSEKKGILTQTQEKSRKYFQKN